MMERWELPKGWEWKKVGEVAQDTERRNPSLRPDESFSYVDIAAIDNKNYCIRLECVKKIKGKDAPSRARKVIHANDVIFATTRPYLKNIAIVPQALDNQICSTGFCVLRAKPGMAIPKYLFFAVLTNSFIHQLTPKGANYPAVNDSDIYQAIIPIPSPNDSARSLAEQRRIVARLELLLGETRAMRDDIDAMRRDLAQVMESALAEVFPNPNGEMPKGWGWKSIDDLFELQQGASMSPRRRQGRNPQPFLRTKNILWGEVDTSDVDVMDFTEDEIERLKLRKGDLLICEGGNVGRAAVWEDQLPLVMYQNHIHRLRRKSDDADPKFYVYWMKAAYQLFKIYQGEESRTAIPNLSGRRLKNFLVPTTSLTEQRRIVAYLEHIAEEIRAMDDLLAQDLRSLEALEQSILAAAFRGEV